MDSVGRGHYWRRTHCTGEHGQNKFVFAAKEKTTGVMSTCVLPARRRLNYQCTLLAHGISTPWRPTMHKMPPCHYKDVVICHCVWHASMCLTFFSAKLLLTCSLFRPDCPPDALPQLGHNVGRIADDSWYTDVNRAFLIFIPIILALSWGLGSRLQNTPEKEIY